MSEITPEKLAELLGELPPEQLKMVLKRVADLANPWTSPEGLLLQQDVLTRVWDDPPLDVYDHD